MDGDNYSKARLLIKIYHEGVITEYQAASDLLQIVKENKINLYDLVLELPDDLSNELSEHIKRKGIL